MQNFKLVEGKTGNRFMEEQFISSVEGLQAGNNSWGC